MSFRDSLDCPRNYRKKCVRLLSFLGSEGVQDFQRRSQPSEQEASWCIIKALLQAFHPCPLQGWALWESPTHWQRGLLQQRDLPGCEFYLGQGWSDGKQAGSLELTFSAKNWPIDCGPPSLQAAYSADAPNGNGVLCLFRVGFWPCRASRFPHYKHRILFA